MFSKCTEVPWELDFRTLLVKLAVLELCKYTQKLLIYTQTNEKISVRTRIIINLP